MMSGAWKTLPWTILFLFVSPASQAIDWTGIDGKDIVLFYPAQISWEMLLTQSDHSGADKFREGKNCAGCHEGEERASGRLLVGDKSVEPTPIAGKPGFLSAHVKAAHDDKNVFVRLSFRAGEQPNAGLDRDFATKVAIMFDDGSVVEAVRAGCWATCHDNLTRMASGGAGEMTKYLARSRLKMSRSGGMEIRPAAELEKIRREGGYLEYWQAWLNPGQPAIAVDGMILENRSVSETPAVVVDAVESDGQWIVTFHRKMRAGAPYKDIVPGRTYTFGVSIHAGHSAQRFHYVSLEKTLVVDTGKADLVARRN